ncbi:MAG: NusG domain II-containing protein [Pleomorphochaeta sp.]
MNKKISLTDILIIVIAILLLIFLYTQTNSSNNNTVKIQCMDDEYLYDLDTDRDIYLTGAIGESHIIIKNSKVWMEESACENKVCLKMNPIDKNGGFIACIPNEILITVEAIDEVVVDDIAK